MEPSVALEWHEVRPEDQSSRREAIYYRLTELEYARGKFVLPYTNVASHMDDLNVNRSNVLKIALKKNLVR